jgi:hypothetical protein
MTPCCLLVVISSAPELVIYVLLLGRHTVCA